MAGLMTGCIIHTTLLAFGVSAVLKNSPQVFFGIKVFGAVYLLYLAVKVFRSSGDIDVNSEETPKGKLWNRFQRGFIMNVLNPKVTIFFLAFFPGFLFSTEMDTVWQFYILGALFIVVSSLVFGAIALLAHPLGRYLHRTPRAGEFLKALQILVFVGIAFFLLLS